MRQEAEHQERVFVGWNGNVNCRSGLLLLLAAFLASLASCSCRHPVAPVPSGGTADAGTCQRSGRRANLRFDIEGVELGIPIVAATVLGQRTYAAIDSGSESIVIDGWFARELGVPLVSTGHVTRDAAGRELKIQGAEGLEIEVEGLGRLPSGLRAVTELGLQRLGIGLILSPQFMAREGYAMVLDLPRRELWFETEQCAFAAERFPGGDAARFPAVTACADSTVATGYLHFSVGASVDGEPATLLLGTGSSRVVIDTPSPIGRRLLERHRTVQVENVGAGGAFSCLKVPAKRVAVGEVVANTPFQICERKQSDSKCVVDGVLGMTVLRSCTLVFSATRATGACQRP